MASNAAFAEVATLAGDPGRAGMLHALMDGRALTATELARVAGVTPQTASGHLSRLTAGGLVAVEKQGRHRYHRLASPAVARRAGSASPRAAAPSPRTHHLDRAVRTCRDGRRDAAEQRGLPGAVGSEEGHDLAGMDVEAHAVHGGERAVAHDQPVHGDDRSVLGGPRRHGGRLPTAAGGGGIVDHDPGDRER